MNKKRAVAAVVLILFICFTVLSPFAVCAVTIHGHECCGSHCPICAAVTAVSVAFHSHLFVLSFLLVVFDWHKKEIYRKIAEKMQNISIFDSMRLLC